LAIRNDLLPASLPGLSRVLGQLRGPEPGPTLLAIGGLHGNEPAGVLALNRVLEKLKGRETRMAGEFVALSGNRAALAEGRRFLSRDLNRAWTHGGIEAARAAQAMNHHAAPGAPEDREQLELLSAIEAPLAAARGPVFLLDLHTTSGPGSPFSTIMDSLRSRHFALGIPVPLILGLGELVEGTLLEYMADRGIPGMVFEGGKHDSPIALDASEAGIWLSLARAGLIQEADFSEVRESRRRLREETRELPRALDLRYRHPVKAGDGFRMLPGMRSFQRVGEGEILARGPGGPVRAPLEGRLLMPLYQTQGEDGFFLIREFHPLWLTLSEILRRARADWILPLLPGIARDPEGEEGLIVDRRVARWFAMDILHLFGYRKKVETGNRLVVLKQRE